MDHTYNYVYTCKTDSGDPFEDSVQTLDDRGGANVPVKIEGDSTVSRLWLVHGGEVDDSASANPEWHGLGMEKEVVDPPLPPNGEPQAYCMSFPTTAGPWEFPVKGCSRRAEMRTAMSTAMRVYFLHRHVRDTVVVLEEGNLPHPRCPRCDMLVP